MCEIVKDYKDGEHKLRIEMKFRKREVERCYILNFSFYKEVKEFGSITEIIEPRDSRNFLLPIKYVQRYNQKAFDKLCNKLKANEKELFSLYEKIIQGNEVYINNILEIIQ